MHAKSAKTVNINECLPGIHVSRAKFSDTVLPLTNTNMKNINPLLVLLVY